MAWSSAIDTVGRIVLAVGSWVQRWWKWLVGATALLLSFVAGWFFNRRRPPSDVSEVREKADSDFQKVKDAIDRDLAVREKAISEDAQDKREAATRDIARETLRVGDNGEDIAEYLRTVGEEMRKP